MKSLIGRHWFAAILLAVILIVVLVLAVLVLINRLAPGLGVQALAFSAAALTAILALLGVLITQGLNAYTAWSGQKRERESTQDDVLQKYFDETRIPRSSSDGQSNQAEQGEVQLHNAERAAAIAKARSAFLRLDSDRKGVLLRFLHDVNLIKKDKDGIAVLSGANLCGAHLEGIDLRGANLRGANLRGANLSDADLSSADLSDTDLSSMELYDVSLADGIRRLLSGWNNPDVDKADLRSAKLKGTDLRGADLREAVGLTQQQINQAVADGTTKLPEDLDRPERPE